MYNTIKRKCPLLFLCFGILIVIFNSCTEPFDTTGVLDDLDSVLVIEATITNELRQQEVRLTRSFEFEATEAPSESNAQVLVLDDKGNEFRFLETEPGLYLSELVFEAQANRDYRLSIITNDGKKYSSRAKQLTQVTPIGEVVAERRINNEGDGIVILVNTFDPTNSSTFYRYEYEETFKIIAPQWRAEDLITVSDDPNDCNVALVFTGENNERVCYRTDLSDTIILTSTAGLVEDRVSQFVVRFIDRDNFILSHRYSILVRQFVQSDAVYTFFETLKDLSGSDNLFSQIQPGLLRGNVFSENDENEIVLGYFDVASVSERRIFFDYDEFFPGEALPPYTNACNRRAPTLLTIDDSCNLSDLIRSNSVQFDLRNQDPTQTFPGPYFVVPRVCGDCTAIGSNVIPPFWID